MILTENAWAKTKPGDMSVVIGQSTCQSQAIWRHIPRGGSDWFMMHKALFAEGDMERPSPASDRAKTPCCCAYFPKRYVMVALAAVGMCLVHAMRVNIAVTAVTILNKDSRYEVNSYRIATSVSAFWLFKIKLFYEIHKITKHALNITVYVFVMVTML